MKAALYVLPVIMMLLSIGAACMYAGAGDVRRAVYWLAAAIITASVTF